jgi:hypothetical protein
MITKVTRLKPTISAPVRAWAQDKANAAYAGEREGGVMETMVTEVCAKRGAVGRHTDDHPGTAGFKVKGLVIRSDGHRLHSDSLDAAGITEGIELQAGDLYEIDVTDAHWTTCPSPESELIFSPYIMADDGRSPKKLAHDISWSLIAASINALRAAA